MARRFVGCLLAAGAVGLAGGCKERSDKPIAGLLAAGAPVMRKEGKEQRPVAVGAHLLPEDRLVATGPAVLEYFGGGLRFLEDGDSLEVGDADEAKLYGPNLPSRRVVEGEVRDAPPVSRIVAARYTNVAVTPPTASDELTTRDYFVAFFTPNGIQNLGSGPRAEGPRKALPPPPHRARVPFIHAGPLGDDGPVATVEDGFVVAETDDLTTAVLLEGRRVPLGRTVRLLVPRGAEVVLELPGEGPGTQRVEVDGPADLRLR